MLLNNDSNPTNGANSECDTDYLNAWT